MNKEAESVYAKFISDMASLYKEATLNYTAKLETGKKLSKPKGVRSVDNTSYYQLKQESEQMSDALQGLYLLLDSNFLYMFTLFETFLSKITQIAIKQNEKTKDNYTRMFSGFCIEKIQSKAPKSERWADYLNQPEEMVKAYSSYVREYKGGQFSLSKTLFQPDTKFESYVIKEKKYFEERERRNLLTHRGTQPDESYYQALKLSLGQKYKEFLKQRIFLKHLLRPIIGGDQNPECPKDLSITPSYLGETFENLTYIASYFYMSQFSSEGDDLNGIFSCFHDCLMMKSKPSERSYYTFIDLTWEIMTAYFFNCVEDDFKTVGTFDMVNYLLIIQEKIDMDKRLQKELKLSKDHDRTKMLKEAISIQKRYLKLEKERLLDKMKFPESQGSLKDLLVFALDDNTDMFISTAKKLLDTNVIEEIYFHEWFIFRNYLRKKKFKEAFNL